MHDLFDWGDKSLEPLWRGWLVAELLSGIHTGLAAFILK